MRQQIIRLIQTQDCGKSRKDCRAYKNKKISHFLSHLFIPPVLFLININEGLFAFSLVIIGVIGLVVQIYKRK